MTPAAIGPDVPHRDISCQVTVNPDALVTVPLLMDAIRYSCGSRRLRVTFAYLAWRLSTLLGAPNHS